jgi:hypothetical protein
MALPVLQAFLAPGAVDETLTRFFLRGLVVFTAQSYVTGGLVPSNYNSITDSSGAVVLTSVYTSATIGSAPDEMLLVSESGSGYTYVYVRSTGAIKIYQGGATTSVPLAEIGATALPAGVTGDKVRFIASWPKQ